MTGMAAKIGIAAFELASPDPARLAAFYMQAFDARLDGKSILIGAQEIRFRRVNSAVVKPAAANATSFQHFAIVVADMQAAMAQLAAMPEWQPISRGGPQLLPARSGGVAAFKFRDPDGHPLELLAFPPDSVPAAWRNVSGLFRGIDHTAITVLDTARSVAFWQAYGFARAGGSINTGPEQAALDGLDAPVVEVTSLSAGGAAPHLELLCYHQPPSFADMRHENDALATAIALRSDADIVTADPDGHRLLSEPD